MENKQKKKLISQYQFTTENNQIFIIKNFQVDEQNFLLNVYLPNMEKEIGELEYIINNNSIFFPNLKVDAEFRNLKIGTALITQLEKIAMQLGMNKIESYINLRQTLTQPLTVVLKRKNFYDKLGFTCEAINNVDGIFIITKQKDKFLKTTPQQNLKLKAIKTYSQ